jgi:hypothetical protein
VPAIYALFRFVCKFYCSKEHAQINISFTYPLYFFIVFQVTLCMFIIQCGASLGLCIFSDAMTHKMYVISRLRLREKADSPKSIHRRERHNERHRRYWARRREISENGWIEELARLTEFYHYSTCLTTVSCFWPMYEMARRYR